MFFDKPKVPSIKDGDLIEINLSWKELRYAKEIDWTIYVKVDNSYIILWYYVSCLLANYNMYRMHEGLAGKQWYEFIKVCDWEKAKDIYKKIDNLKLAKNPIDIEISNLNASLFE